MEETDVQKLIDQSHKTYFGKRVGDTPTDAIQLTPKGYVDNQISSVLVAVASIAASVSSVMSTPDAVFGDGSDGVANFNGGVVVAASIIGSNSYQLTRNAFYSSVSISSVVTVKPVNYILFNKGTLTNTGTINADGGDANNGSNGGNASAGVVGTSGGGGTGGIRASADGYIPSVLSGGVGGTGTGGGTNSASAQPPSVLGTPVFHSFTTTSSKAGGTGGQGGISTSFSSPQNGGVSSGAAATLYNMPPRLPFNYNYFLDKNTDNTFSFYQGNPSTGGGGGGAGGNGNVLSYGGGGGGGGGSGAPGGIIPIISNVIINNGIITAKGGRGGNGGNGGNAAPNPPSGDAGGGGTGGGGSGGDGGLVMYVTSSYTNNGQVIVTGGLGGLTGQTPGSSSGGGGGVGQLGIDGVVGSSGIVFGVVI